MPKAIPAEQQQSSQSQRDRYTQLQKATANFLEAYKNRHNERVRFTASGLLPYNVKRIQAADLIQKVSSSTFATYTAECDTSYSGKAKGISIPAEQLSLLYGALKATLFVALYQLELEDKQYKKGYLAQLPFFGATPLKDTALYSLLLETLQIDTLSAISYTDLTDSLDKLMEYACDKTFTEAEGLSILRDVATVRDAFNIPGRSLEATGAMARA